MKELTLKINKDCVIISYQNEYVIIMIEKDVHLTECVESAVVEKFGFNKNVGNQFSNEVVALYLGESYPVKKTKSEVMRDT